MSRSAERAVTKVNAIIRARTADVQFARTPAMRNHTFYRAAFQLTGSVQPNGSVSTQRQCSNVERVLSASRDWAVLEGFEQVAPTDDADRLELIVDDGNARNTVGEKQADRLGNGGLRVKSDGMSAHDLMDPLVESGEIPFGLGCAAHIGAQGSQKVPVRNDSAQLPVLVHHEQVVKTHGVEDLFDHLEPVIHFDGNDPRRHDIAHKHRHALQSHIISRVPADKSALAHGVSFATK